MKRRKLCSLLLAGSLILSSLSSSIGAYAEDVNDTTVSQDEDNPNETVISTEDSSVQILTEEEMQKLGITEFTSEDTTDEDITESSDDEETTSENVITNEETQDTTTNDETTTEVTSDDQEEVSEEVTEKDSEDISTEEVTEESSEDISEEASEEDTEELVKTSSFTEKVEGVSTANLDFSSKELLVGTEDPTIFTWDTQVISEYNGVYLVKFDDIQTTENAYTYYFKKAEFVSTNNIFKVADEEFIENESSESTTADLSNINQSDDAISVLNDIVDTIDNDIDTDAIKSNKVIALIDSGVDADDLVGSVSVIGDDTSDDNGHGTRMYNYIKEEAPDAKILSIKALGSNGKGQASDIYAAIQYAIEAKVDIINLSLSANCIEENNIVVQAIEDAIDAGITVVGAAGNNGSNAKYFIPGCIDKAIIIGACNDFGLKLSTSNYGKTVDYYVLALSTSEAAARYSALTLYNIKDRELKIYPADEVAYTEEELGIINETDDFIINENETTKYNTTENITFTYNNNSYTITVPEYINMGATGTYYSGSSYGRKIANDYGYMGYPSDPVGSNNSHYTFPGKTVAGSGGDYYIPSATYPTTIYSGVPGSYTTAGNYFNAWTTLNSSYTMDLGDGVFVGGNVWCCESSKSRSHGPSITAAWAALVTDSSHYKVVMINSKPWVFIPYYRTGLAGNSFDSSEQHLAFSGYVRYPVPTNIYYYTTMQKKSTEIDFSMNDIRYTVYSGSGSNAKPFFKFTLDKNGKVKSVTKIQDLTNYKMNSNNTWTDSSGNIYARFYSPNGTTAGNQTFWISESHTNDYYEYNGWYESNYAENTTVDLSKHKNTSGSSNYITWGSLETAKDGEKYHYSDPQILKTNGSSLSSLSNSPNYIVTAMRKKSTDAKQPSLAGIVYGLYSDSNAKIAELTLDADGYAKSIVFNSNQFSNMDSSKTTVYSNSAKDDVAYAVKDATIGTHNCKVIVSRSDKITSSWYYKEISTNTNYVLDTTTKTNVIALTDEAVSWDGSKYTGIAEASEVSIPKNTPEYTKYYAQIIKTDGNGNVLEGVPFKYKISKDGGTTWDDWSSEKTTNASGIIQVSTGDKEYLKGDKIPKIIWKEQSWGNKTIKLHNGTTTTTVNNNKYIINANELPSSSGTNMSSSSYASCSYTHKNNEYYPYYIAVKKTDENGNILKDVPIQITFSGGTGSYSGHVEYTKDTGIALFEIPYSEHFTSAPKVTLTEVWGQTGYTSNATLIKNGNSTSVPYTQYEISWSDTNLSTYTTSTEALNSAHLISAENPTYFPYYGTIKKVDDEGNALQGVPFKIHIGTTAPSNWDSINIYTTGADGTYTYKTADRFTYTSTAPKMYVREVDWTGYDVKLNGKSVNKNDYIVDTTAKDPQTMYKTSEEAQAAKITYENIKKHYFYVSLNKVSVGAGTDDMTGTQYALFWNKTNAQNWATDPDNTDIMAIFTLDKDGKIASISNGTAFAQGYMGIHFRDTSTSGPSVVSYNGNKYLKIQVYKDTTSTGTYTAQQGIDKLKEGSTNPLYIREITANGNHELNPNIMKVELTENEYTLIKGDKNDLNNPLTNVETVYITMSMKKSNEGQNYSMEGIRYNLAHVKDGNTTIIATFTLAADGSVSSITTANLLVDGHGTMSVEDGGKWLKITFDDGRDVTDEETNGFFTLKEREDSNNSFYDINTNTTKIDSSKLEHGSMTQVTATLNQTITDEYKDALTDYSYTPYYLVIDKNIIDSNKNSFNANGIPFNITIKDSTGKVVKTKNGIRTGSYYNFDNGETKSIQTYEAVTTDSIVNPLADQTFSFTITRDGNAIKNKNNKNVVYTTTKKDGRIIVYLGTYKKLDNGKCPITVDVQEAWTESVKADKITVDGTELIIEKVNSKDYIHTFKKTGIVPSEMNKNAATADSTTFTITDAKTLKVDNRQSTTAITLIKTSGESTSSNTYKYTHNVTTKSGQTNCPNMNYSLEGATYEITNEEGDVLGTLTCNADGTTDVLDISEDFNDGNPTLEAKNYYAKEIVSGKNYALNSTKVNITVTKDNNINNPAVFNVYDDILLDPVTIDLNKVDADTYSDLSQEGSIAAKYTIRYYPVEIISGHYYTAAELDALDIKPEKYEITLVKNATTGKYEFNTTDLIGEQSMGYFTITEDIAPTGYGITGSKFIVTLANGTKQEVNNEIPVFILDREDSTNPNAAIFSYYVQNNQRYRLLEDQSTGLLEITSVEPTSVPPTFDSVSISNTTGTHIGRVNNETLDTDSITETFSIKDVPLDRVYTYKATLMDITDLNNTKAITTKSVDYKSTGIAEQSFEIKFDSFKPQAGHTYATVVRIYGKDKDGNVVERYTHNTDYSVETQKVYYPSISTTIKSNSTNTQAGALIANEKVTDTITYSNFPVGTKVVFSGTLYDLTNNTKINETPVTKEVTIDNKTSTDMIFTYDARGLKGHTLAAVVTASVNSEVVIAHNLNKSEISEMVYYPDVNTELLASTNTHLGSVQVNETAVETVNFKNVPAGVEVVAVGTLYDVTANKNVGSIVTSDPKTSTGLEQQTITLPAFTYDARGLAGHTLSAKVEIKVGNVVIGTHNDDYSDIKETIYYPTVATDLLSGNTNTQLGSKSNTETAIETVTYTNIPKDTTITLIGELWNTKTNEIITLADSKTQVTATSKSEGLGENKATINFTYDSTGLDDTVIAAKVFVKLGNNDITKHNDDLKDAREMVYYPKLSTELLSIYGNKYYKVGKVNTTEDEKETAKETVTFKGIPKDVEVTYYAELRDLSNSNAIVKLSNGTNNVVTKTVKSTGLGEQSFDIIFEYNSMNLADHTISAKVTAKIGNNLIGTHNEDLTDLKETIYYPNGHTSAADIDTTTKLVSNSETAKVYDDFMFSNLVKGISYKLTGTLHKRDKNGKDLGVLEDSKGNAISKTITFTIDAEGRINATGAESATVTSSTEETVSGTIRVLFTVDSTLLEGITTTAFETVKVEDYDIFVHANIDDKDQQVHFMKLETDLVSDKTGTNVAALVREDIVKDTLTFEKVPYGSAIVFNGTMMDKDAKSELIINGNKVTGTVTLSVDNNGNVSTSSRIQAEVTGIKDSKTNTVSGTIVLTYKYDSSELRNKTLVSFVTATTNEKTVAVHNKYDNARETIYYPDIHTNANDINTKTNVATLGLTKVVDTVTLNNLVCSKTYQVVGTIHIKDEANGNPVLKLNGKEVTKKATITVAADGTVTLNNAENAQFTVTDGAIDGTVDIIFDVDTSSILGRDIVAFEKLLTEPVELVAHEDINDKDQTVHVPDGGTTAMDAQTKDHVGTVLENGEITLPDTVHLDNIAVGHTYHIEGILMDKETEESVKIDGKEVTASANFTVAADGTVTSVNTVENVIDGTNEDTVSFDIILNFTFASKDLKGKDVVVFETGYFVKTNADQTTTNVKIFEEDDINNLDQTVHFPEVSTIATDDTYKDHIGIASETESITEKSILTNLVFGMTYEVKATVMDQLTGEALKDKSGNDVTKTAVVTISNDGKTVTAVEKGTDTQLVVTIDRVDEDDHCIDITVDIPIVFDSTGTNGKSIVLFEDLSHNDIIVKSHHDINDTNEQIHYFELVLYKKGLQDPTVAEFTLTQNGSTMKYSKLDNGSYIINPKGTITVLNPDSDGIIHIKGFNADPYVLTEIKTAKGVNLLTDPITIQFVSDDSDKDNIIRGLEVSIGGKKALITSTDPEKPYTIQLSVTNIDSITLKTGGNGTYMFYILALIILLASGASVIIYRKRRKNQ